MYLIQKTEQFERWLRKIKDIKAKAIVLARLKNAQMGNLGDYKSVGRKVSELKINYGPGYRIYFTKRQKVIIVLLIGGDKSSQSKDIKKAQRMATEIGA